MKCQIDTSVSHFATTPDQYVLRVSKNRITAEHRGFWTWLWAHIPFFQSQYKLENVLQNFSKFSYDELTSVQGLDIQRLSRALILKLEHYNEKHHTDLDWHEPQKATQKVVSTEAVAHQDLFRDQISSLVADVQLPWAKEQVEQFLKKNWSLCEANMKDIFRALTADLFTSYDARRKKIVVGGTLSTDGWGDYVQMHLTAKNLKQAMPEATVSVCTALRKGAPALSNPGVEDLTYASESEMHKKKVRSKIYAADIRISIPHGYFFDKPGVRVEELGFNPGQNFALGISPGSFSHMGIPLTAPSRKGLDELSHIPLKSHLKKPFFLAYLKTDHNNQEQHRASFILTAASVQSGNFNVICPVEHLRSLDREKLQGKGVARVVLLDGNCKEKESLQVQKEGKEITIINPFPLSNDDWMILLRFCEPLVGCTGDASFTEVISNAKIPFYQVRWHKIDFVKQLQESFPQLQAYFSMLLESLTELGKSPDIGPLDLHALNDEMKNFLDYIQKYHCTNDILTNLVKRKLAYIDIPELEKREEELVKQWVQGQITLHEAVALFAALLHKV